MQLCNPKDCRTRLLCPWDFRGKNTGVSCHFLLSSQPRNQTCGSCVSPALQVDSLPLIHWRSSTIKYSTSLEYYSVITIQHTKWCQWFVCLSPSAKMLAPQARRVLFLSFIIVSSVPRTDPEPDKCSIYICWVSDELTECVKKTLCLKRDRSVEKELNVIPNFISVHLRILKRIYFVPYSFICSNLFSPASFPIPQ